MNRLRAQVPDPSTLVPIDPERVALERRIEQTKGRIIEDLNRAGRLVRDVAARTGRGVGTLALIAGLAVASAIVFAVVRMRGRRIRIVWK